MKKTRVAFVIFQSLLIFPRSLSFLGAGSLPTRSVVGKSPHHHHWSSVRQQTSCLAAAIAPGDTILVVGGTGGVGQLVTRKLQARGNYKVRVSSRDKERAQATIGDNRVDVVVYDLINGSDEELKNVLDGISAVVISVGTTAFPTTKWQKGNTPQAVDKVAVERIAREAAKSSALKKIVLLTSIGVNRTDKMPFVILNLFGVLDAKKSGEEAVKAAAARNPDLEYVIVRPGRLVGGPFTNLDVVRLLQIEGGAGNGADIQAGDVLSGECKRDVCAEAVVQSLTNEACGNVDYSIISNENKALNDEQWTSAFQTLKA